MIPVTKTHLPSIDNFHNQLKKIWQAGWLTNNGSLTRELADKLNKYLGVSGLELVANGTLALQLAIKALDLKGETITTPYSHVATTTSILWEGCDPIFVDIDDKSFCINPDLIEAAITKRTSAILATHVYGYPCDVLRIERIAKKHNLKVIYDAAHCFGVKLYGESILLHGDCSTLSFHATKLFHTAEGGAVVSKDPKISQRIGLIKKFGYIGEDECLDFGINAKMTELHAAMGLCILPEINKLISCQRKLSTLYDNQLVGKSFTRPSVPDELDYNYGYYPVVFSSHEKMMLARHALLDKGIMPRRYFWPSLNTLPYLKSKLRRPCPVAEDISSRVLSLPLYPELKKSDVENICHIILRGIR